MIQFNLLPEVKLAYVKAKRTKQTVVLVSVVAAAASLGIMLLLLLSVKVVQARHISSLDNQISNATNQLQNTPNLSKILTIQNQLNTLTSLHSQKPVVSRLPNYFSELVPASATVSNLTISFTTKSITVNGTADSLSTVDQFVDTLKFATFKTSAKSTSSQAFSDVILSSFSYSSASGATYQISATFNPSIFSSNYNISSLNIKTQITTRSILNQPLFQPQPSSTSSSSNNSSSSSTQ